MSCKPSVCQMTWDVACWQLPQITTIFRDKTRCPVKGGAWLPRFDDVQESLKLIFCVEQ